MKTPCLLVALVIGYTAMGQLRYQWPEGNMPNVPLLKNRMGTLPKVYQHPQRDMLVPFLLRNTVPPGIYALPQDGMPCIVPNMLGATPIPNVAGVLQLPFRTTMPNKAPYTFPKQNPVR